MNITLDSFKKDIEQIKGMGAENAVEFLAGYHKEFLKTIRNCMEEVDRLGKLCPSLYPLLDVGLVICECDVCDKFFEDKGMIEKDTPQTIAVLGSHKQVKKVVNYIWDSIPDVMEEVVKERGYVKQ